VTAVRPKGRRLVAAAGRHVPVGSRALEVAFIVAPQNRGWILEGICVDLRARFVGRSTIHYADVGPPPRAHAYFFSHLSLYFPAARFLPARSRVAILFTHPSRPLAVEERHVLDRYRPVIVCMSSEGMDYLASNGVSVELLQLAVPGADPDRFLPHERRGGSVGFCSAFYERKNPSVMFDIVASLPSERFMLVGRNWEQSPWADTIAALPNLRYMSADYSDYPELYAQMDVFVSASTLEGGPMPLLEAMLSNVVPVATRTGFARDLIVDGVNGYLTETTSAASEFLAPIADARRSRTDIRATVVQFSIDAYAQQVAGLLDVGTRSRS
jgi:glycosyltransferase involved in cell wall biosynthesis